LTGYTRDELLRLNVRDLVVPDDLAASPLRFDQARQGKPVRLDWRLIRKDDAVIHVEVHAVALDEGRFQAIIRDVSERKQAEQALLQSEEQYRRLFEYANDSIFLIDIETARIVDVNRNAVKHLGYSREELLGLRPEDIDVPLDSGERRAVQRELVTTGMLIFEHKHRRKDGSTMPVETSSRIIDAGGRKVILNFTRDISRRRAAEEAERDQRLFAEGLSVTAASLSSTLDLKEVLNRILEQVTRVMRTETANIMLIEEGLARIVGHRGYESYLSEEVLLALRTPVETRYSAHHGSERRAADCTDTAATGIG
jgi:PAS domain S-box-containing protein